MPCRFQRKRECRFFRPGIENRDQPTGAVTPDKNPGLGFGRGAGQTNLIAEVRILEILVDAFTQVNEITLIFLTDDGPFCFIGIRLIYSDSDTKVSLVVL